jgi:cobalamin synthase
VSRDHNVWAIRFGLAFALALVLYVYLDWQALRSFDDPRAWVLNALVPAGLLFVLALVVFFGRAQRHE